MVWPPCCGKGVVAQQAGGRLMPGSRKVSYVVSIWREPQPDGVSAWRGSLETAAGQCFDFGALTELNRFLCELGGWMDPPISSPPWATYTKGETAMFTTE